MGLKIKSFIITFLIITGFAATINAAWEGPTEVVVGTWGANAGQFGLDQQDSGDFLPREFGVDKDGIIIIGDKVNNRIQIFKPDGSLSKVINRPTEIKDILWPWTLIVLAEGNSVLAELSIFDYTGAILNKINITRSERYAVTNGYIIYNMDTKTFSLYSPTGQLIRTTTERPLELGKVTEKKTTTGYTYTIQYPDLVNSNNVKTYTVTVPKPVKEFKRDASGNLYGIHQYPVAKVMRFDDNGNIIAELQMPDTQREPRWFDGNEWRSSLIVSYGEPVIAPNGDVYTWKRTPTAYSIIKWTWR